MHNPMQPFTHFHWLSLLLEKYNINELNLTKCRSIREVAECLQILNTYKSGWVNAIIYMIWNSWGIIHLFMIWDNDNNMIITDEVNYWSTVERSSWRELSTLHILYLLWGPKKNLKHTLLTTLWNGMENGHSYAQTGKSMHLILLTLMNYFHLLRASKGMLSEKKYSNCSLLVPDNTITSEWKVMVVRMIGGK